MTGQLAGKVAIITGSNKGLGLSMARLFAREGAKVAMVSRTRETIEAAAATVRAEGGDVIAVTCDVGQRDQVQAAVDRTVAEWGRVDILINNAHDTTDIHHTIEDTSDALIERQMRSALYGSFYFMQSCLPHLKQSRGKVINFGSSAGIKGLANYFAYAASKEALRALTRCAAREWGEFGINVNTICPVAATEMFSDPEKNPQMAQMAAMRALGRVGTADEDISPVALFLASPASNYITGHTFMADGGGAIDTGR